MGKIEDIVIDADAGRIAYAVLSFGGFLGLDKKYFAIPCTVLRFSLSECEQETVGKRSRLGQGLAEYGRCRMGESKSSPNTIG
jgi:hypothetical protein